MCDGLFACLIVCLIACVCARVVVRWFVCVGAYLLVFCSIVCLFLFLFGCFDA